MSKSIKSPVIRIGLALAMLLGFSAAANAQVQIRLGDNHIGASIRFGEAPPPRFAPVVPPAAIRHDHFYDRPYGRPGWELPPRAYLNPYNDAYFRRFRPGYRPILVGTTQYYGYPTLPPFAAIRCGERSRLLSFGGHLLPAKAL